MGGYREVRGGRKVVTRRGPLHGSLCSVGGDDYHSPGAKRDSIRPIHESASLESWMNEYSKERRGKILIVVVERDPHLRKLEQYFLEEAGRGGVRRQRDRGSCPGS